MGVSGSGAGMGGGRVDLQVGAEIAMWGFLQPKDILTCKLQP